jgi:hypothetical protein
MNLALIQKKLDELNGKKTKTDKPKSELDALLWKPEVGKNIIRMLPNIYNEEWPIEEIKFYWLNNRQYVAPKVGEYDPLIEKFNAFIPRTAQPMPKDEYKALAEARRPLEGVTSYYAYILVRGKEHEGPRIWKFSQGVYKHLLEGAFNPALDYGDVTDPRNGRDLIVTYTLPQSDKEFAKTSVNPRGQESVATTDATVLEKIKAMPNVWSFYKPATPEELLEAAAAHYGSKPSPTEPKAEHPLFDAHVPKLGVPLQERPNQVQTPPQNVQTPVNDVTDEFSKLLAGIELP